MSLTDALCRMEWQDAKGVGNCTCPNLFIPKQLPLSEATRRPVSGVFACAQSGPPVIWNVTSSTQLEA
jgi:hypothetical protein